MHPVVFSAAWFQRAQRPLLTLLNAPVIGRELRDALAIRRCDVGGDGRIVGLLPHAYVVANPDGTFTMDVRTHPKYAQRLRSQYAAIWRAAHAWDRFVANPLVPALNLGFDSLTVYPEPGSPGTTTTDGWLGRDGVDEIWGTLRAGAGNNGDGGSTTILVDLKASATLNQFFGIYRGFIFFDTSSLTSAAAISAATASVWGVSQADALAATPTLDLYTATPAATTQLAVSDFSQVGSISQTGAPVTYAAYVTGAYNALVLNGTGLGNISKTSVTAFALRNGNYDAANVVPPWVSLARSQFIVNSADQAGTTNDPKLVVTFSLSGAGGPGRGGYAAWQAPIISGGA